jgi:hypothetical protein
MSGWDDEVASLLEDAALVAEFGDGLDALLSAATAPATLEELRGEAGVRAAFRAERPTPRINRSPVSPPRRRRSRPLGRAAIVLGSVAGVMATTTGLAAASALPTPAQDAVVRAFDVVGLDIGPPDVLDVVRVTTTPAGPATPVTGAVTMTGTPARSIRGWDVAPRRSKDEPSTVNRAPVAAATPGSPDANPRGRGTGPTAGRPPSTTPPSTTPPSTTPPSTTPPSTTPPSSSPPVTNPPPGGSHGPPPGGSHGPPPGHKHHRP